LLAGCATTQATRSYQENVHQFNVAVVQWNASFTAVQRQAVILRSHPGATIDARLSAAFARAAARGAPTLRGMIAATQRELEPQRATMRPDEIEYAEAIRDLAYRIATLAEDRESIELWRVQLTHQAVDAAAAAQRQAFWQTAILTILVAGSGAPPALPTVPTPNPAPAPVFCSSQATGGGFVNTVCR